MTKLFLAVLVGVFIPTGASATTWYVAATGSDGNTCTQAQSPSTPKSTIQAGLSCVGFSAGAGAGDTVQVASGTYAETISSWPSGTPGNPFVLRSATQYGAVIRPGAVATQILYFNSGYVTVDGFTVDGVNVNANNIWLNSGTSEITIQNCEIKNTRVGDGTGPGSFEAIYAYLTTNAKILNNRIHDIGVGATAHFNHAVYWTSSDSLIEGNTIYNVGGFGLQIYNAYGYSLNNNIVRNNRIYDFAQAGTANGIYISTGTNNTAYNNLIYQTASNPNAVGLSLKDNGNSAYNNTIYNNGYMGLEVAGTGSVARNNIVFHNTADIVLGGSGYTVDHNLTTDPKFTAVSSSDFRPQAISPAIDAAMAVAQVSTDADGVPRPQGGAYDIGAFEYKSSSTLSAPAAPTNVRVVR